MPYTATWYIEKEVIYVTYSGVMTVDELRSSLLEIKNLVESSSRPLVHTISDVGDVITPVGIKDSIGLVREVGTNDRAGWTLTIREKSIVMKMGAALGSSIFKLRYRTFDTFEQAIAHLKLVDSTIHWEQANSEVVKDR